MRIQISILMPWKRLRVVSISCGSDYATLSLPLSAGLASARRPRHAGREVSIWSEEWKHECEIADPAGVKPDMLQAMLYGTQGDEGESAQGIASSRRGGRGTARQRDRAVQAGPGLKRRKSRRGYRRAGAGPSALARISLPVSPLNSSDA